MEHRIEKLTDYPNLSQRSYEVLKKMIVLHEIPPGEKIDEDFLAQQLGVSRTPIRESLCRLENEGIVKIIPRRGAFVVKHSKEKIIEILLLREVLEGLAARLAADHVDETTIDEMRSLFKDFSESNIRDQSKNYTQADFKFHTLVVKKSKNSLLMGMMNTLNDHIQMLRLRTVAFRGRPEHSLSEHFKIIEALEKRDPSLAESLMRDHIHNVRESVIRNIEGD
ncbi:MAG: GntR family transcriptional regulator [Thermodesulfobacteriota bacterium]